MWSAVYAFTDLPNFASVSQTAVQSAHYLISHMGCLLKMRTYNLNHSLSKLNSKLKLKL